MAHQKSPPGAAATGAKRAKEDFVPTVTEATFVAEARTPESIPPVGPLEIAIAGRSNVGKSTLLNRLAARRSLARTSKTPGRTRGIIFYDLQVLGLSVPSLRLADLPGYGYAQVSQTERASWQPLIEGYTQRRPTLAFFAVLVDSRRGIEPEESQLIEWLDALGVPLQVAFTKVDKLNTSERAKLVAQLPRLFPALTLRRALLISGETGEGVPALWREIGKALQNHGSDFSSNIADEGVPA